MKVCGLARISLRPSYWAEMTIALDCTFMPRASRRTVRRSTSMKPRLWRVSLYSRPGLPRPTIRMGRLSVIELIRSRHVHPPEDRHISIRMNTNLHLPSQNRANNVQSPHRLFPEIERKIFSPEQKPERLPQEEGSGKIGYSLQKVGFYAK